MVYDIYSWKAKDELAVAAYWVENYQLSYDLCLELLTNSSITDIETKQRIQKNLDFAKEKINQLSLVN